MFRYKPLVRLLDERELEEVKEVVGGAKLDDSTTAACGHDGVAGGALDKRWLDRSPEKSRSKVITFLLRHALVFREKSSYVIQRLGP